MSEATGTLLVGEGLPVLGPVPGGSHWHAAYIVRICGDVLAPFDSVDDPLGIHSHRDGLIHVHPYSAEGGYEQATLGVFAEAMGFELSTGELTLPGGGTWRDGDMCGDQPGRVFVDRWVGPNSDSDVVRVFDSPETVRFEADREMYQIAFAPHSSPPVVPPTSDQLYELSAAVAEIEPWVAVDHSADSALIKVWPIAETQSPPCADNAVEERVLYGTPSCFVPGEPAFNASAAFEAARRPDQIPAF